MIKKTSFLFILTILLAAAVPLLAATLDINTDYRLRGISYDYDPTVESSTATQHSLSYYSQRLKVGVTGNFDKGIEVGAKLTSLGIVGTTATVGAVPFSKTDFSPFVENAYIKFKSFSDWPLDVIAGRQTISYGDGLILDDNGTGLNAIRLIGHFKLPVPFSRGNTLPLDLEYFTIQVNETLTANSDTDIYGGILSLYLGKNLFEFGYFDESDFSGSTYIRDPGSPIAAVNLWPTKAIDKRFLDFRLGEKEKIAAYQIEFAKQSGYVTRLDGSQINFDGLGYLISGKLVNENTKIGKVTARALISYASGNSDTNSFADDKSFSPTYTKKYDGLERGGYGTIFGATPGDSFVQVPDGYSGNDTVNVGIDISPVYNLTFGMDYFFLATSEAPKGAPESTGFERFYGANFSLGSELDLSVKLNNSKYSAISLAYCTYAPPQNSAIWPNSKSITSFRLEIAAKF